MNNKEPLTVMPMDKLKELPNGKHIILRKNGSRRVITINTDPSLSDQQWKEDCDTNTILQKFTKTGQVTHLAKRQGSFADVSNVEELLPSLMKLKNAEQEFSQLPSTIRNRFNNSPIELLKFIQNPDNREEAIKLGLIPEPEKPGPEKSPAGTKSGGRGSKKAPASDTPPDPASDGNE